MILLTPLFNGLGAFFGRFLSDALLKFAALKVLLISIFSISFPVIIKNLISSLFDAFTTVAGSVTSGGAESAIINISGLTGYLASQFMIADCLSIILTAIVIRISLNFIPFVG